MLTFHNKSMHSWKDSDEDVPQFTVSFASVIALLSENYQSMVTVKQSFNLITFGTLTEICSTLNKELKRHCPSFTWQVIFSQQFAKLSF